MIKYIIGEIYRLVHKKSLYIYFGVLLIGYVLIVFIRSVGANESSILNDSSNLFTFLPLFIGGFLFTAIYTDDLSSKSLITVVGFGLGKAKIVISKLIISIILAAIILALVPIIIYASYALFGILATENTIKMLYLMDLQCFLIIIAYMTLSGIAVYGLQKITLSVILYFLLSVNVVSGLISLAFNMISPSLKNILMPTISNKVILGITNGGLAAPICEYIIYVAIAATLSIIVFQKKEMEF